MNEGDTHEYEKLLFLANASNICLKRKKKISKGVGGILEGGRSRSISTNQLLPDIL